MRSPQIHVSATLPSPLPEALAVLLPASGSLPPDITSVLSAAEAAYVGDQQARKAPLIRLVRYGAGILYILPLPDKPTPDLTREAARKLGHQLQALLAPDRVDSLHILGAGIAADLPLALAEGVILSSYHFAPFKTKPEEPAPVRLRQVTVSGASEADALWLASVLDGVFLARDLVNTPFSHQS
ncbi:MAG TPA: hypothetical protein VEI97_03320, partial [bacterium]|nr:hypothetical protein [bacterium]